MTETTKPGYAFNHIADIGNGQQFQVTGSLPIGATKEEIEAEFGKFVSVIQKLTARVSLPAHRDAVHKMRIQVKNFETTLAELNTRFTDKKSLPQNEIANRASIETNIRHDRERLAYLEDVLAQAEKEAA